MNTEFSQAMTSSARKMLRALCRTSRRLLQYVLRCGVLLLLTISFTAPLSAGEVEITWIGDKQQPLKGRAELVTHTDESIAAVVEVMRNSVGDEAAEQLRQALEQTKGVPLVAEDYTYYSFGVTNNDQVRRADRIAVLVEFYNGKAHKIGERVAEYEIALKPKQDDNLTVECEDKLCRESSQIFVTLQSADFVELQYGAADEIAFGWNDRRWFLEDHWAEAQTLTLRTFSRMAYGDKVFDGRVFPNGELKSQKERYYRLQRDELPAGHPEFVEAYEFERSGAAFAYAYGLLPGFQVKEGQRTKPGFLDAGISNTNIKGNIGAGEYVQIPVVEADKKSVLVVVRPVCRLRAGHRRLRTKIRFTLGKKVMKARDHERIERTVREWLEPVSIGEVAEVCGPVSGTMVKRWNAETQVEQVERELGPADAMVATADGEVLVYGAIKLKFQAGKLAGFEKKPDS
ncbi:MAG: hypothetical protein OEQ39_01480 [Gammaproteobacteria bacterium]|nr:hypothetical protein [Gammaproteobacteria bacterium]